MHQQVRMSIPKSLDDGSRARLDEKSLVEILTLLKAKNLRSASRIRADDRDEFVFSVHHRPGDDLPDQQACDILTDANYEAGVVQVRNFLVDDHEGSLLARVKEVEDEEGEPVIEVHILSSEPNRKVPVQLVTRRMLNR